MAEKDLENKKVQIQVNMNKANLCSNFLLMACHEPAVVSKNNLHITAYMSAAYQRIFFSTENCCWARLPLKDFTDLFVM